MGNDLLAMALDALKDIEGAVCSDARSVVIARSVIAAIEAAQAQPEFAKHQPCGCVVCTCADPDRCHGCGAKNCGTHAPGEMPNPVYKTAQPVGVPAGYIGVSSEADFDKYTWTFEMEGDYRVSAGRYLIARLDAAPSIPVDEKVLRPVEGVFNQMGLPKGPVLHSPSGLAFDSVIAAVDGKDLLPLTPEEHTETRGLSIVAEFQKFIDELQSLINNSRGIYGLHLNGDESPWNELLQGGRFEEWLGLPLADAQAAIAGAKK